MPDRSRAIPSIFEELAVAPAQSFDDSLELSPTFAAHLVSRYGAYHEALVKQQQFKAKQQRVKEKKQALALRSKLAHIHQHGPENATETEQASVHEASLQTQSSGRETMLSQLPSMSSEDVANLLQTHPLPNVSHSEGMYPTAGFVTRFSHNDQLRPPRFSEYILGIGIGLVVGTNRGL